MKERLERLERELGELEGRLMGAVVQLIRITDELRRMKEETRVVP